MDIQFFGHSIFTSNFSAKGEDGPYETFVEQIVQKYDLPRKDVWIPTCSEERLLLEIKRYRSPIDYAIIAHADPMTVIFPRINHDFMSAKICNENQKYWTKKGGPTWHVAKTLRFFSERYNETQAESQVYWSDFAPEIENYRNWHYCPELQKNRYYGALIQIDQYLKQKNIKTIHLVRTEAIPSWFSFSHGIVDKEILNFQYEPPHATTYAKSLNAITEQGNKIITEKLIRYMQKYRKYAIEFQ